MTLGLALIKKPACPRPPSRAALTQVKATDNSDAAPRRRYPKQGATVTEPTATNQTDTDTPPYQPSAGPRYDNLGITPLIPVSADMDGYFGGRYRLRR